MNDGNPFNRTKLVQKSNSDKKIRQPLKLFIGNKKKNAALAPAPMANSQKKQVTDYIRNV